MGDAREVRSKGVPRAVGRLVFERGPFVGFAEQTRKTIFLETIKKKVVALGDAKFFALKQLGLIVD